MFNFKANSRQANRVDLIYPVIVFFLLLSCTNAKRKNPLSIDLAEVGIDKRGIVELHKKSAEEGRSYGSQFVNRRGDIIMCGLYSATSLYYMNLKDRESAIIDFPFIFNYEKDRIHFDEDYITFFHNNNLLSYSLASKEMDTVAVDLFEEDEFIKKELYGGGIYKDDDTYIVNYGKVGSGNFDNYIDHFAAYLINPDTIFKSLPYTSEFEHAYVHYSEVIPALDSNFVYYTFSVIPKIVQYNLRTGEIRRTAHLADGTSYLTYDASKITDIGYLTTYSYNTAMNLKIFTLSDYIVLLSIFPKGTNTPSKNAWIYKLTFFDKDLNLLEEKLLETPFLRNYVSAKNNALFFTNIPNGTVYVYTVSTK